MSESLEITVGPTEFWDERNQCFVNVEKTTLKLMHSLISVSKWEMKWKIPFVTTRDKTPEQEIDYIKCMCTNIKSVDPMAFLAFTRKNMEDIRKYIEDPMSATKITHQKKEGASGKVESITSELIYYWMIQAQIPAEFQKWHLNRLLALIELCGKKNLPKDKQNSMSKADILKRNAELNAARKAKFNTKG